MSYLLDILPLTTKAMASCFSSSSPFPARPRAGWVPYEIWEGSKRGGMFREIPLNQTNTPRGYKLFWVQEFWRLGGRDEAYCPLTANGQ